MSGENETRECFRLGQWQGVQSNQLKGPAVSLKAKQGLGANGGGVLMGIFRRLRCTSSCSGNQMIRERNMM